MRGVSALVSRLVRRRPVDLARRPDDRDRGAGRRALLRRLGSERGAALPRLHRVAAVDAAVGRAPGGGRLPGRPASAARARHDLAGAEPDPVGGLVRLRRPGLRRPAGGVRPGVRAAGCRWAAVWPSGSPSSTGTRSPDSPLVNPSIGSDGSAVPAAAPWLRHIWPSLAGIGSDIALPDVLEGAYDRSAAARRIVGDPDVGRRPAAPGPGHPAAAGLQVRNGTGWSTRCR